MDEYEFDLRDYLKVIWNRKWIVALVTIVAIGVTAAYYYSQPNKYRVEGIYRLNETHGSVKQRLIPEYSFTAINSEDEYREEKRGEYRIEEETFRLVTILQLGSSEVELISMDKALSILKSQDRIQELVNSEQFNQIGWANTRDEAVSWIASHFEAQIRGLNVIKLRIEGAKEPRVLKNLLNSLLKISERELTKQIIYQIDEDVEERHIEKIESLEAEKIKLNWEINKQINKVKVKYQDMINQLQTDLKGINTKAKDMNLKVGENNLTFEGFSFRKRYEPLMND